MPVQLRRHSHEKLPRERLLWFFVTGSAEFEVVLDRIFKSLFQIIDRFALKGDHITSVDHLPMEDACLLVDFYYGFIALVVHGWNPSGPIPASAKKRLIEATAPR